MSDEEIDLPWWALGPGPEVKKIVDDYIVAMILTEAKKEGGG